MSALRVCCWVGYGWIGGLRFCFASQRFFRCVGKGFARSVVVAGGPHPAAPLKITCFDNAFVLDPSEMLFGSFEPLLHPMKPPGSREAAVSFK